MLGILIQKPQPILSLLAAIAFTLLYAFTPLCYAAEVKFVAATAKLFKHPHDLTLDPSGKYLFVADMKNNSVKILDPQNLDIIGEIGKGELSAPHDVEFDNKGRLIVADSGNHRLVIYTLNNFNVRKKLIFASGLRSPEGIAMSTRGYIYVANTAGHNVVRINDSAKNSASATGKAGVAETEFIRPHDLEVLDDRLYVTDPGNNRIKILNLDLQNLQILGGSKYGFNEPKYLALDEQGRLYVADQYNDRIQIFAAYPGHGRLIDSITSYTINNKTYYLNRPEGVEASKNRIWIADTYNNRILLYKRSE